MKVLLLLIPLFFLFSSCTRYGYHPHYIISQEDIPSTQDRDVN